MKRRIEVAAGRKAFSKIESQIPHPLAQGARRVGHPLHSQILNFPSGFQTYLADTAYYVTGGGFVVGHGDYFDRGRVIMGAKY
jgi:hypothetical protein